MFIPQLTATTPPKEEFIQTCTSTREFVTTLEFLRAHKEFSVHESDAKKIAHFVTTGCTGASARFIKVVNLLTKARLSIVSALNLAREFAISDDTTTDAFIAIFRLSYLSDVLDLDVKTSLDIAQGLSVRFSGHTKKILPDFTALVEFCMQEKGLGLPVPKCALLAESISKLGENFKDPISGPFIKLYHFNRSKKGPGLPLFDAIKVAQDVLQNGPAASDNFIQAFKYATSKGGLGLEAKQAVKFAQKMAANTIKNSKLP